MFFLTKKMLVAIGEFKCEVQQFVKCTFEEYLIGSFKAKQFSGSMIEFIHSCD
jgi:hypothetical protein